jgi:hypothetical protein
MCTDEIIIERGRRLSGDTVNSLLDAAVARQLALRPQLTIDEALMRATASTRAPPNDRNSNVIVKTLKLLVSRAHRRLHFLCCHENSDLNGRLAGRHLRRQPQQLSNMPQRALNALRGVWTLMQHNCQCHWSRSGKYRIG